MYRSCFALLFFVASCSNVDGQYTNSTSTNHIVPPQSSTVIDSMHLRSAAHLESTSKIDTLIYASNPKFEVSEVTVHNDTLVIVSGSELVSYPMGKFAAPQKFLERYRGFSLSYKDEDPDSTGSVRVYTLRKNNNLIRVFKAEEGGPLEIASGKIVDRNVPLVTGITVGVTQLAFLNTFFTKPLDLKNHQIKIVAIYYVVDGEMQYYKFINNILAEIKLASTFTVQ